METSDMKNIEMSDVALSKKEKRNIAENIREVELLPEEIRKIGLKAKEKATLDLNYKEDGEVGSLAKDLDDVRSRLAAAKKNPGILTKRIEVEKLN
jgi:hypothetical protein